MEEKEIDIYAILDWSPAHAALDSLNGYRPDRPNP